MKLRIARKIRANPARYHMQSQERAHNRLGGVWRPGLSKRDLRRIRNWESGWHGRWHGGCFLFRMTPNGLEIHQLEPFTF